MAEGRAVADENVQRNGRECLTSRQVHVRQRGAPRRKRSQCLVCHFRTSTRTQFAQELATSQRHRHELLLSQTFGKGADVDVGPEGSVARNPAPLARNTCTRCQSAQGKEAKNAHAQLPRQSADDVVGAPRGIGQGDGDGSGWGEHGRCGRAAHSELRHQLPIGVINAHGVARIVEAVVGAC